MKHPFRRAWVACVAVAIAFAAISAPALAQDSYYREVTVDGRIYVFSSEKAQKTWEASKELAVGTVTRPGYGLNGETVVFDGPASVDAFNKKYGKIDAPPTDVKAVDYKLPFDVKYRMPGLRLTFPKFEMNWVNRAQFRYTYEDPDTNAPQSDKGSFRIPRFRMKWDGWIYSKELTYELQIDVAQVSSTGTNILQDANINYDFTGGKKAFQLKIGQFKAPFSQQQLTSSGNQQFVDRSITDAFFVPGRQLGLQLWGQIGPGGVADMIDWRFAIFNGNGRTVAANDNDKYEYVARLAFSPFGSPGYSESNLESYDFRMGVAVEYNNNNRKVLTTDPPTGTDTERELGASLVIKAARVLFVYGEYYSQTVRNIANARTRSNGFTAQAGVLVIPEKLEIAGRYAQIDPNTNRDNDLRKEIRGAISWYMNRHNWKLQADYGQIRDQNANGANGEKPKNDKELRVQAQLLF